MTWSTPTYETRCCVARVSHQAELARAELQEKMTGLSCLPPRAFELIEFSDGMQWIFRDCEMDLTTGVWTVYFEAIGDNPYSIEIQEFAADPCLGQFSTAGDLSSGVNRAWAPDLYDYLLDLFTVKGED